MHFLIAHFSSPIKFGANPLANSSGWLLNFSFVKVHKLLVTIRETTKNDSIPIRWQHEADELEPIQAILVYRRMNFIPPEESFSVQQCKRNLMCVYTCDDEAAKWLGPLIAGGGSFAPVNHIFKYHSGKKTFCGLGHHTGAIHKCTCLSGFTFEVYRMLVHDA